MTFGSSLDLDEDPQNVGPNLRFKLFDTSDYISGKYLNGNNVGFLR